MSEFNDLKLYRVAAFRFGVNYTNNGQFIKNYVCKKSNNSIKQI